MVKPTVDLSSGVRLVRCANCGRVQRDPGRQRATCSYCGTSPVPSYSYSRGSSFYPRPMERRP